MTFEEFLEINKKYGITFMWIKEMQNISKEDYEEHAKKQAEAFKANFDALFNDDSDEEDDF